MNDACQSVMAAYITHDKGGQYAMDVMNYAKHGYMESGPYGFIMARPVNTHDEHDVMMSRWYKPEEADAWYVHWYAGGGGDSMERMISRLPYPLQKIGWSRSLKGRTSIKFYPFWRMKRLLIEQVTRNMWEQL
jgi:hypothetical protein